MSSAALLTHLYSFTRNVAAANAHLNSLLRLICGKEAIVFVIDVPILAPITIGIAVSMVNTPPATRPTTIEVVDDEI
jgi:hypothetical protein